VNDPIKILGYVLFGIYALSSLWLFLNALVQLHLLWHYKRKRKKLPPQPLPHALPFVSIQVPVYNEKYVIRRLLEALSRLDYPRDKFEIQVLDDSTDETIAIIDAVAERLQHDNINIAVLRREKRIGYKAGALQYGLPFCKGDLIAIFDADFIPEPLFLKKSIPYFKDPQVGLVQARWEHLNRNQNQLTRIQTFLLDTHFSVEQAGRSEAGYFINFCGTAGIWRKQCIEEGGGWDGSVLSEDLDLSYRAQLKGWKLVYDPDIKVPAELPSVIEAFKIQQFRWTKGMAQISRKTLRKVISTALPAGKKLHGAFHLLSSAVFVCLFINAILALPLLVFRNLYPEFIQLTRYTAFSSLNLIALTLFYYTGTQRSNGTGNRIFFTHFPLFLVVYMGLSVQNAVAVLQGFFGSSSVFVRTPKFAVTSVQNNAYLSKGFNWINGLEVALFCYALYGIYISVYLNDYFMLLFFLMFGYGLGFIIYQSLQLINPKNRWKMA
jgi:cellulose synthase/poly-beta-1,6-N-acetylglucosamine synthase-like glycosyltransferase